MSVAKLLIVGSPGGSQSKFVSAISEVKVRSSSKTPRGDSEFVPMDFGRVSVDEDLDLQMFGVERDQVGVIADAIAPGIVGAVVLIDKTEAADPHFSAQALDELSHRGIVHIIAGTTGVNKQSLQMSLDLPSNSEVVSCKPADRESVKTTIIKVLEAALEAAESDAA